MARSRKLLTVGALGAATVALVASTSVTGAYFSDSKSGEIKGTVGTLLVSTDGSFGEGANKLNFEFKNLLPGEAQTAVIKFKNTGSVPQDVYLTFPNRPALHALNNAGTFAEVQILNDGGASLFHSTNLNDGRRLSETGNTCGTFSPDGCWPLPVELKVASNVTPDASGQVSFSFNYPTKKTGQGGVFNAYPVSEAFGADAAGPAGDGLPFNVVATQVGRTP